jgi:DNA-binding ferritin-like protein
MGLIDYLTTKKAATPKVESAESESKENGEECNEKCTMPELVFEMLNGSTKIHLNHLKVSGVGSYAAHKAMNDFYDGVKDQADGLAESYQGVTGKLMDYPKSCEFPEMKTAEDCVAYLDKLHMKVCDVQCECEYSEIINDLDGVKSLINTTKYKLLFLS